MLGAKEAVDRSNQNFRTPSKSKSPVTGGAKVVRIATNPRTSWAGYRGVARLSRFGLGLVAAAALLAGGVASMGPPSARTTTPTKASETSATGGAYTALTPYRLLDTRTTTPKETLGAGGS